MNKCESCYNMECVFVDNQIPFFDSENCQNYRGLTNADKIRVMDDVGLAAWYCHNRDCRGCEFGASDGCHILDWLKAPVEDVDNGN